MLSAEAAHFVSILRYPPLDRRARLPYDESMKNVSLKNVSLRLLLLSCLLPSSAPAQQAVPGPPAPPVVTLAQALQAMPAASVGDGSVALTVGAERVPPALLPPPTGAEADLLGNPIPTPQLLAAQYGRLGGWFGHVYALAPPTMTVLSSNPALADLPLSLLAAQHPTPFLIGSLSEDQLRRMSTEGLAYSELTPDQQGLLRAMLPHPFQVVPAGLQPPKGVDFQKPGADIQTLIKQQQALNQDYQQHWRTTPDEALSSALRLYGFLTAEFNFDAPGGAGIGVRPGDDGFGTTGAYKLANGGHTDIVFAPGGSQIQAYLRASAPNAPKDGDFQWNRRDLERPVPLQGLKTVDELVARVAGATHLELYADAHYGSLPLMVLGDLHKPQPAADVMQALALCVCGAWRQVGPTYVLTDDVQGLGTRQKFLREMVQTWSNRLSESGKAVGGHLRDLDWTHALHFADGDIGALPPAQVDALGKGENYGTLPWKSLPAPLQAALRGQLTRHFDGDNMASFELAGKSIAQGLKPDSPAGVTLNLQLAVSLPDTGAMALAEAYRVQMPHEEAAAPTSASANSVRVDKPLRGVLCAPKTPDEARAVVARLPNMGLNTLFVDVFTNGRTYFPNAAMPPASDAAAGVLQAALDAARPLHMPVYAVLDTLCWRKDGAGPHPKPWPDGYSEDLTISGEAPDHSVQRQMEANSIRADFERDYEMQEKGNQGWASPLDPAVRALLPRLVRELAASKGIAGVVFQDTLPPGYLGNANQEYDEEGIALGYAPANRLAYLRTHHADPVDLSPGYDNLSLWLPTDGFQAQFEVSIPGFQSFAGGARDDWAKLRGDADKSLLADCFIAVRQVASTLPLFMRERRIGVTFDPWIAPKKLNEYASTDSLSYPLRQINAASILSIPYGPVERAHPQWFVWSATDSGPAGENGKRAGGEIFDLLKGYSPDSLADTLDRLDVFLKKPTRP